MDETLNQTVPPNEQQVELVQMVEISALPKAAPIDSGSKSSIANALFQRLLLLCFSIGSLVN